MSRPIVIESLTLEGFGLYGGEVRVAFPRGLGVLVGPNEQGKSTLVAGIAAVLFGLPGASDPEAFGVGRYRNWNDPSRFTGELTLDAGGVRYRMRRNFDNHRISLSRLDEKGWVEEVVGEHNPSAKRPNVAYTDWLVSLFQHSSRELFQSTFCVVQPLPHVERLSAELQSLLAGTGGGGGHEVALKRLVDAAKKLTKGTGALGLTPRDGRTEGSLDEARAGIALLEEEIQASQRLVQGLHEAAEEVARLASEAKDRRDRLESVKKSLQAFESWRKHAHQLRILSEEAVKLARAKERYTLLESKLEEAQQKQLGLYPELIDAPPGFGDGLAHLDEALGRVRELNGVIAEADRLSRELAALRERRRATEVPVPPGETAVSWMRQVVRDLDAASRAWEEFEATRSRLKALRASLSTEYAPFEEAAPATLEAIEGYETQRTALTEALERARLDVKRAEEARDEAVRARGRLDERFPRAARWAEDAHRIDSLIDLSRACDEGKRRLEELRAAWIKRARIALGGAVIGGAVLGALAAMSGLAANGGLAVALGWIVAFATLAILAVPGARRRKRGIEAERAEVDRLEAERKALASQLGDVGALALAELGALADEIRRYKEAAELVSPLEAKAPGDEELERLRAIAHEAEARLTALDDALAAPREAFADFQKAFGAWKAIRREAEAAEHELERTLAAWGLAGVLPEAVEGTRCPGHSEGSASMWSRLLEAVTALRPDSLASDGASFGELVEALFVLQRDVSELAERARAQDELDREISDLEKRHSLLVGSDGHELIRTHLDWIESQCDRLAGEFGGDWRGVWETVREQAGLAKAHVSIDALLSRLPSPFREAVEAAGKSVEGARLRWRKFVELQETIRGARQGMDSALSAFECRDLPALDSRLTLTQTQLAMELGAMETLAKDHPSLPLPRTDGVYDDVDERYVSLEREARRLEGELDRIEEKRVELVRRQAELHGSAPANIAQAELQLKAFKEKEERLSIELEALALAHRELGAAAAEYYDSHLGRLEEQASEYFSTVTERPGRRVRLDDELRVNALESDGKGVVPAQLSQGARDQLYLSLRMAIGDLLGARHRPPFILDDPFHNCDDERLDAIRQALVQLARERQILLFTHRREFAAWGEPITIKRGGDRREGA